VLGTKIMWAYFRDFVRLARRRGLQDVPPCEVPAAVLPNLRRFVWMRREDTTRQAVSLWKALQTQKWRKDSDEEVGGQGLRFSFAAVNHLKLRIDEHNAAWQAFFHGCGAEPIEVLYEELVADYEGTVSRLLEGIGIPIPEGFAAEAPRMRRQADELSEEWVRLYNEGALVRTAQKG
jgi:trehalose 2-sulfotransferase